MRLFILLTRFLFLQWSRVFLRILTSFVFYNRYFISCHQRNLTCANYGLHIYACVSLVLHMFVQDLIIKVIKYSGTDRNVEKILLAKQEVSSEKIIVEANGVLLSLKKDSGTNKGKLILSL